VTRGLTIHVSMSNAPRKALVERNLRQCGSSVAESPSAAADLIVTDRPPCRRTQGGRLADAAARAGRPPRVISAAQIPWALRPTPPPGADRRRMIVVVDLTGRCRPAFKDVGEAIRLHLEPPPRGWRRTPFDPADPTHDPQGGAAPPGVGHCGICGRPFRCAEDHRASPEHQRAVSESIAFRVLDAIAAEHSFRKETPASDGEQQER
jgi:hypothetical protein